MSLSTECAAALIPFRYPSQNLRRIHSYKGVGIPEFITFYQNALQLTRVHCASFYQSALRREQDEDITPFAWIPVGKVQFGLCFALIYL